MRMSERDGVSVAAFDEDDFSNVSLLEDTIQHLMERLKNCKLVVDLSQVASVNSLGMSILVAAEGIALICDVQIAFASVQPGVRRLLGLAGLDRVLPIHDTVSEAVRALGRSPRHGAPRPPSSLSS